MSKEFINRVYDSLAGLLMETYRIPDVENAFSEGSFCMQRYSEMTEAYARLCDRLGVVDEDEDVEIIINALMDIEREMSMKMYHYGALFGEDN